jgi:hypothetical protein
MTSILQIVPADGWYVRDRKGDTARVAVFALVEDHTENGTTRTVIPMITCDELVEEVQFPYELAHECDPVENLEPWPHEVESGHDGGTDAS